MQKKSPNTDKIFKKIIRMSRKVSWLQVVGEFDKSSEIIKQVEGLIRNFQEEIPKGLEEPHCSLLYNKGMIAIIRGYLTLSFDTINELLTVAENYGNKTYVANAFTQMALYYWRSGDLNRALEYCDRSIMLIEETCSNKKDLVSLIFRINAHSVAMRVAIDKGILELAREYFEGIEKIYELNTEQFLLSPKLFDFLKFQYKYNKARILQLSMRARDRAMAEELFKEVIEAEDAIAFHKIQALIGLCELSLVELKLTSEMDVVSEIKPLLEKLIAFAQKLKSDRHLTEAYILQGKLALLTFDIKTARRFLIQAQRIAERRGYKGVAKEIASLHNTLMGKLDKWEELEKSNAPLSERIELAGIEDHLKGKFRTRMMKMERVTKEEVTVYEDLQTCLVCKGSAGGFNIYVCPECKSIYCKACAQAVIDLENLCWSCNSPIDASKPVKPYKPEIGVGDIKESKKPKKY